MNLQKTEGNLQPKQRVKPQLSHLKNAEPLVKALVAEHPDATLIELCELFAHQTGNWVSSTAMCRPKQKLGLNRKKKYGIVAKPQQKESKKSEKNIGFRSNISSQKTWYFWMKQGFCLAPARTHARSQPGTRVSSLKPFYRGAKVTVIGAISINKVLAVMTMDDSMDAAAFAVFIEKFLCPQLWAGAVVVMDNLPAHKLASIVPMIEAYGASVICLSPYYPDFYPIELWWSQLKSFLRKFAPTNAFMIDRIIAVALNLINPQP